MHEQCNTWIKTEHVNQEVQKHGVTPNLWPEIGS